MPVYQIQSERVKIHKKQALLKLSDKSLFFHIVLQPGKAYGTIDRSGKRRLRKGEVVFV